MTSTGPGSSASATRNGSSPIGAAMTAWSGRVARAIASAGVCGSRPSSGRSLNQSCERARGHIDRGGGRRVGKALPVEIARHCAVLGVTRDVLQTACAFAIGQRDADPGSCALRGGNAWHNINGDVGRLACVDFFRCTAKNKRIAALETDHAFALLGKTHHQGIDVFLFA